MKKRILLGIVLSVSLLSTGLYASNQNNSLPEHVKEKLAIKKLADEEERANEERASKYTDADRPKLQKEVYDYERGFVEVGEEKIVYPPEIQIPAPTVQFNYINITSVMYTHDNMVIIGSLKSDPSTGIIKNFWSKNYNINSGKESISGIESYEFEGTGKLEFTKIYKNTKKAYFKTENGEEYYFDYSSLKGNVPGLKATKNRPVKEEEVLGVQ